MTGAYNPPTGSDRPSAGSVRLSLRLGTMCQRSGRRARPGSGEGGASWEYVWMWGVIAGVLAVVSAALLSGRGAGLLAGLQHDVSDGSLPRQRSKTFAHHGRGDPRVRGLCRRRCASRLRARPGRRGQGDALSSRAASARSCPLPRSASRAIAPTWARTPRVVRGVLTRPVQLARKIAQLVRDRPRPASRVVSHTGNRRDVIRRARPNQQLLHREQPRVPLCPHAARPGPPARQHSVRRTSRWAWRCRSWGRRCRASWWACSRAACHRP